MHPQLGSFIELGLPFGAKPRLILAHINTEALLTKSPEIETDRSLTAFVSRLRLASHGRNMRTIKDQLSRLSACTIRLGLIKDGHAVTVNSQIVTAFDLWFPKDDRQRVLWPTTIRLSLDYFESLMGHAVPLNEQALVALSHSAMALDIYAWLAQRLHRIPAGKSALVPWTALQSQFGWHYEEIRMFRRAFKIALAQVHTQYREARFDVGEQGMKLWTSSPPVSKRIILVQG
jgi:hypothetical protein